MKPILDCFKEDIDTYNSEENKEFKEKFKSLGVVSKVFSMRITMFSSNTPRGVNDYQRQAFAKKNRNI